MLHIYYWVTHFINCHIRSTNIWLFKGELLVFLVNGGFSTKYWIAWCLQTENVILKYMSMAKSLLKVNANSGVFIVDFEHHQLINLVFLLLTINMYLIPGKRIIILTQPIKSNNLKFTHPRFNFRIVKLDLWVRGPS